MYENGLEQKNLKFVPPLKRFYFFNSLPYLKALVQGTKGQAK